MEYLLDTADVAAIRRGCEYYPLAGVTTNPSILAKEGRDVWEVLEEIRGIIGPDRILFVQTVQTRAEEMVKEAKLIAGRLGGSFGVKIPIGEEGLKATMQLRKEGIPVLMTAIFSPAQALIAARAGAAYVAPYVNRLDNISGNGCKVVAEIVRQFALYGLPCKVLAASFKNVEQVQRCASAGCQCATVSAELLKALISHPMTDAALEGFAADWKRAYGGRTILEME